MVKNMEMAEGEGRLLGDTLEVIRFTEGVSAKLHRVLDEAKIYQVVKEEFAKSDRYIAVILLLDGDGASLKLTEISIAPSKLKMLERASGLGAKEYVIKLSKSSICRQAVREGKTVHANISDVIGEFLPHPVAYLISKTMGYDKQSCILTPLHRRGKVIGALGVSCTDSCEYLLPSVENLALHISTALELADEYAQRKRAVQALKRYHDHLGELVEERTAELKAVNEKLRQEISERKETGEALRKIEQEKLAILNSMSEIMVYQDTEYRILWTNKAAADSVALSIEQLVGRHCYEIWHQSDKPCVGCPVAKARETGKPQEAEMATPDGRVWFVRGYPVQDANENLVGVVEVTLDITERKRAEEALRESEEFSSSLLTNAPNPVLVINPDTSLRYVNPALYRLTGFSSTEVIGRKTPYPWWTAETLEKTARDLKQAMRKGAVKLEELFQKKNGERFWVEITSAPVTTNGELKYYLANWLDITERKQAEEALRESQQKFQKMFESVTDGISVVDLKGVIIETNQRTVEMHGFASKDELLGRSASELIAPRDRERIAANMRKAIKEGTIRGVEYTLLKADGTEFPGELSTSVIRDASGKTVAHITIARDIARRKRMEEALQAEKNKLQSLIDAIEYGLTIQDRDYNIIYEGTLQRKIFGDHLGEKCYRVYEGQEKICEGCPVEKAFRDGKSHTSERRTVAPSGEVIFWENTANPIRDAAGRVISCLEITRNITERKRMEEALRESEERFRSIVENSQAGVMILDDAYRFVYVNDELCRISGYSPKEVIGQDFRQFLDEESQQLVAERYIRRQRGEEVPPRYEFNIVKKDGQKRRVEISSAVIKDSAGEVRTVAQILDITERKQAEEALRESQKFSSSLLESSPNPISVVNLDTSIRYVNPAFEKLAGFTLAEIVGRKAPYPWWPEGKRARILAAFKDAIEHGGRRTERNFQNKNGERFWVALNSAPVMDGGEPVYLILNWLDITERKQAEEKEKELQQELYLAQRLASVGELAAGVAHEINNPLTGVLGFSQRLMRKSTDEKVRRDLEIIHSEARRAAEVVQSLLTFARRRQPKKEYADINDIVHKTLELRAYALQTGNIEVVTTLAPSLPQIMVDFPQMQEVFLNIILNAEQAMSEANGRGKLIIKARRLKKYLRISFADDGPGISPGNLDKVFDPFFTTREEKGGTGLGLSACHGIVTEHGGRIYARSKAGKGATFFVELPLSPAEAGVAS